MKSKIYELIGRAVVYLGFWIMATSVAMNILVYVVCNCCTTIR